MLFKVVFHGFKHCMHKKRGEKNEESEQNIGYKFFKIYFIEVKCLNRQSTATSLIIFKNLTHFGKQYIAMNSFLFSDGVQLVTVKMRETLFPHSNVSHQETIHHTREISILKI